MVRFTPLRGAPAAAFDEAAVRQLMEDWRAFAANLAKELTDGGYLAITAGTTMPAPTTHALRAPLRAPCVCNANGTLFATNPRLADDVLLMKIIARFDGSLEEANEAASKCQCVLEARLGDSLQRAFPDQFDVEVEVTGIVPLSMTPTTGTTASFAAPQQYTMQFDMFAMTKSMELIPSALSVAAVQVLSNAMYYITPLEPTATLVASLKAAHAAEMAAMEAKVKCMEALMEARTKDMEARMGAMAAMEAKVKGMRRCG